MVAEAIRTARTARASGEILVRGDCAYGNSAVVNACVRTGVRFSVVLIKNRAVSSAIAAIPRRRVATVALPGRGRRLGHRRVDLRRPGRRSRIHRVRLYQTSGHRPAGPATTPPRAASARVLALGRPADPPRPGQPHRHVKINSHERRSTRRPRHGSRFSARAASSPGGESVRAGYGRRSCRDRVAARR